MEDSSPRVRLRQMLDQLRGQKRKAAEYILARPGEVAVYSLRKVAGLALVSPGTLVTLAHDLGYEAYNDLRARFQQEETGVVDYFSSGVRALQGRTQSSDLDELIGRSMAADIGNIEHALQDQAVVTAIQEAAALLHTSRRIYVVGRRASFGLMHYFHYLAQLVRDNVVFLDGAGDMSGDQLDGIGSDDVIICCGFYPYVRSVIELVDTAASLGARVISITDSPASPVGRPAACVIPISVDSPWMFGSITSAVVMVQALIAQLAALGGAPVLDRVKAREKMLAELSVFAR